MKRFVFFLIVVCMFGALSATQVTNLRATAISHDGFTARWDAMSGAETYNIEAYQGMEHSFGFDENTSPPAGWSFDLAQVYNYPVGARSTPNILLFNNLMSRVRTPILDSPGTISFYAKYSGSTITTRYCNLLIQISGDGVVWTDIDSLYASPRAGSDITAIYKRFSYDLDVDGEHYIRFIVTQRNGLNIFVDDIQYTQLSSPVPISENIALHPAYRVGSLSAATDYIFRVKAAITDSEYTDWQGLRTSELDSSSSTGTAIAGQSASIAVSADGGSSNQSISILPSSPGIYDFSVQAQLLESTFAYTIACEDGAALNAAYSISHPGLNVIGCTSSHGQITEYSSVNGITAFVIYGFEGKSSLTLYLETGDTLPVQLSSFYVNFLGGTACRITWLSQSESQLLGYYVLRSASSLLDDAEYISPLIPATNSSQPSAYSYTDPEAVLPAYYWLLASDYDGDEQYFGPVFQDAPDGEEVVEIPQLYRMKVFPNPGAESISLQLKLEQMQMVYFKVYNSKGQLVESGCLGVCPKGDYQRALPTGKRLASGVYYLVLEGKDFLLKDKFVVQK